MKKILLLLAVYCIGLWGCGGGNSAIGGLSPEQQEYADVLLAFVNKVKERDSAGAKLFVSGDLKYNGEASGYDNFQRRLDDYLSKVENPSMTVVGEMGVIILDSDRKQAKVSAYVSYKDINSEGVLGDNLEVIVQIGSSSRKGIIEFRARNNEIAKFPPQLQ